MAFCSGVSPSILLFGRDIKIKFDLLKPPIKDIAERVKNNQIQYSGGRKDAFLKIKMFW